MKGAARQGWTWFDNANSEHSKYFIEKKAFNVTHKSFVIWNTFAISIIVVLLAARLANGSAHNHAMRKKINTNIIIFHNYHSLAVMFSNAQHKELQALLHENNHYLLVFFCTENRRQVFGHFERRKAVGFFFFCWRIKSRGRWRWGSKYCHLV